MRYTYIVDGNKITCVSHYAEKEVTGTAKCSPTDEFNAFAGQILARRRCNEKVAKKRLARATKCLNEARNMLKEAVARVHKMSRYFEESQREYTEAVNDRKLAEEALNS